MLSPIGSMAHPESWCAVRTISSGNTWTRTPIGYQYREEETPWRKEARAVAVSSSSRQSCIRYE